MLRQLIRSRRVNRSTLLARVAGQAAGATPTRRGSFLIMVVGTLALLAVVTIVYVAIGRSDAQASTVVVKQSERDSVTNSFRDYLLGIMSDDVFDVVYLGERDADNEPLFRRETWDYPSTAHRMRLPGFAQFDLNEPVTVGGTNTAAWFEPTGNMTGADPWLASSRPTLLNIDGSADTETDPQAFWEERLDWAHISNVAPDGTFVNLFNLRDNFDATHWEMRGDGGGELTRLQGSPEVGGNRRSRDLDYGGQAELMYEEFARPAEYDSRLPGLMYASVDPLYGPDEEDYLLYQYADADGDGFLDSRWIEMVLARDESSPDDVQWLIAPDDRFRYFFATRIEDLSGRINLNTATDATFSPNASDPWGMTPAGVDARSLLTMFDLYGDADIGFGYDQHEQPQGGPSAEDYSSYDMITAYAAGEKAYDALRMLLDYGVMPGPGYQGLFDISGGDIEREFSSPYWQISPTDYYETQAGFGPFGGEGAAGSLLGRSLGSDSLIDLLAFNAVNDDRIRSTLETALGGRADGYIDFSPLRDDRSRRIERDGRYTIVGRRISMDDDAKAAALTDIRAQVTVLSGARPLAPTLATPNSALDADDLRLDIDTLFDPNGGTSLVQGQDLFELYGDAFAPYSEIQNHWNIGNNAQFQTLYYGWRGPELAIRTAAHMAVNMLDAYDGGDKPSARTVVLNGSDTFRTDELGGRDQSGLPPRDPMYPWKLLDLDFEFDPSTDHPRLADRQIAGMPDAVNIFGVEAQPFIVAAASYMTYTDVPNDNGGDPDFPQDRNGDGIWDVNLNFRPSIDGLADATNGDCLFEVLAFHLHNPFDESITLGGDANDLTNMKIGQYYIQYGDPTVHPNSSHFKLEDIDSPGSSISIGAGESRVFYVLSGDPSDIVDRIEAASDTIDIVDPDAWVSNWISGQLGGDAVRIGWVNTADGTVTGTPPWDSDPSKSYYSLQGDVGQKGSTETARKTIRLWRVEKPQYDQDNGGHPSDDGLDEVLLNDTVNDTLVDRLRDPQSGSPTLDRQLVESKRQDGAIDNAEIGGEPGDPPVSDDNRGLTITRYGVVARRQDPNSAAGTVPRGGLPAYCIEAKTGTSLTNLEGVDRSGSDTTLAISDFGGPNSKNRLADFVLSRGRLIDVMHQDPDEWSKTAADWGGTDPNIGSNLANVPFQGGPNSAPLYIEPAINNDRYEVDLGGGPVNVMRAADFLSVMGIGPHQIPDPAYHGDNEDIEWTTLSEAMAFALYYDEPANATDSVYFDAFDMPTGGGWGTALLDTAHVRHDAFVPFRDNNGDGVFDPGGDVRWGRGVPFASSIFDFATTIPREFGSLASPTHGQININTASRPVMRALPGISPPPAMGPDGVPVFWWSGSDHNATSDIATTMFTYRDRNALYPRDLTGGEPDTLMDFRDSNDGAWDSAGEAPGVDPADNGRFEAVGIDAIREEPGFRSLGEVTLIRNWVHPGSTNLGYPYAHDIDRFGYDGDNLDEEGVYSAGYDADGDGIRDDDDEIDDDFDERLALANAVMNSASVRSDFFAVWFVVHGYQESDVKNLGRNDPLVPTVARRFVMVVDRSNVVEPGQRPRIVLFKEVPL